MRLLSPDELRERAEAFPRGCRVRAVHFAHHETGTVNDNETVPPGTLGTVAGKPDATGTIFTEWDNGARLGFLTADQVERIE